MLLIKKLASIPLFLLIFALTSLEAEKVLNTPNLIFSFSTDTLIQVAVFSLLLIFSSFLFVVAAVLASDWLIIGISALIASILPAIFINGNNGLIFAVGSFVSFLLINLVVQNHLKTYFTFQPTVLFSSSIKNLSKLLILFITIAFYFSFSALITQQKGFEIPDSLLDATLKLSPQIEGLEQSGESLPDLNISPEIIEAVKKNPQLAKQYGVDPNMLEQLSKTAQKAETPQEFIKETVKSQFQKMVEPYLTYIPYLMAFLFFLTLTSIASLLSIVVSPLLFLTFYALEKTKFITFTKEMREVKKMVV